MNYQCPTPTKTWFRFSRLPFQVRCGRSARRISCVGHWTWFETRKVGPPVRTSEWHRGGNRSRVDEEKAVLAELKVSEGHRKRLRGDQPCHAREPKVEVTGLDGADLAKSRQPEQRLPSTTEGAARKAGRRHLVGAGRHMTCAPQGTDSGRAPPSDLSPHVRSKRLIYVEMAYRNFWTHLRPTNWPKSQARQSRQKKREDSPPLY